MANLQLDILVVPTYDVNTLGVADASVYPTNPPVVSAPSIEIDVPGFGMDRCSILVLFLSDFRFDHQLWILFGSCSKRKNHLGKIGYQHPEIRRGIRCYHRGSADFCLDSGSMI